MPKKKKQTKMPLAQNTKRKGVLDDVADSGIATAFPTSESPEVLEFGVEVV